MSDILETVKIKDHADSFIVINKSDFVEGEHVLFDEKITEKPAKNSKTKG